MISLDTETNGVSFYHGCKPFFVTTCMPDGNQPVWEWSVDPLTREVDVIAEEVDEIRELLDATDHIVGHNIKFDATALGAIGIDFPWEKAHDTVIAGHILASGRPHDLTTMVLDYLGEDIEEYELALEKLVNECRRHVRSLYPEWMIAKEGLPMLPSAKKEIWRNDYWLPKALALHEQLDPADYGPHYTTLETYSNADSSYTLLLWGAVESELKRRDLWEIYLAKMKVLPVAMKMEKRGITVSKSRLLSKKREYVAASEEAGKIALGIAEDYNYDLQLPKSGRNGSLNTFVFDVLKLPVIKTSEKTEAPSLDADVKDEYELTLPKNTLPHLFIKSLNAKSASDKAVSNLEGYERYWLPHGDSDCYVLHPNINTIGTAHTRWSISDPNSQNISRREGYNLREVMGPTQWREWWSADAQNIELRIPAYEAGEEELIAIFERPKDPPYYGSYHAFIYALLYPDLFRKFGGKHLKSDDPDRYGTVKNGNFCKQYGGQRRKTDLTFGYPGAFDLIENRCPKIARLSAKQIAIAERTGCVETIPSKFINSRQGYPLMCSRSDYGDVVPTIPFNYHVSGTAGIWMQSALIRCDEQLEAWRRDGFDGHIIMNIHDEIVFDFPRGKTQFENLPRMKALQKLMELGGQDIGIPTPVAMELHLDNWSVGISA